MTYTCQTTEISDVIIQLTIKTDTVTMPERGEYRNTEAGRIL